MLRKKTRCTCWQCLWREADHLQTNKYPQFYHYKMRQSNCIFFYCLLFKRKLKRNTDLGSRLGETNPIEMSAVLWKRDLWCVRCTVPEWTKILFGVTLTPNPSHDTFRFFILHHPKSSIHPFDMHILYFPGMFCLTLPVIFMALHWTCCGYV